MLTAFTWPCGCCPAPSGRDACMLDCAHMQHTRRITPCPEHPLGRCGHTPLHRRERQQTCAPGQPLAARACLTENWIPQPPPPLALPTWPPQASCTSLKVPETPDLCKLKHVTHCIKHHRTQVTVSVSLRMSRSRCAGDGTARKQPPDHQGKGRAWKQATPAPGGRASASPRT